MELSVQRGKRQVNKNAYYPSVSAEREKARDGEYRTSQGTGEKEEEAGGVEGEKPLEEGAGAEPSVTMA